MAHPSGLVRISPLDLWSQPILRLPGMRTLCRSDYLLVTPFERDRLVSEGYAVDYEEPISTDPVMPTPFIIDSTPDDPGVIEATAVLVADDAPIESEPVPAPSETIAVATSTAPVPIAHAATTSRGRGRRKGGNQ